MTHIPVLLQQVLDYLEPKQGFTIVDATLGAGGYSAEICNAIGESGVLIGIDQDKNAVEQARRKFFSSKCNSKFVVSNFRDIDRVASDLHIEALDGVVFDLGFSSTQLETSGRGFSFLKDEPLLMTLKADPDDSDITAMHIVDSWGEQAIADVLFGYGEEKRARKIARRIVKAREEKAIETTSELAEIIESASPRRGKTHPATKAFQALRIATNDELKALSEALEKSFELLRVGGRIVVVSFHSLEDRAVKNFFRAKAKEGRVKILTKKPIVPDEEEVNNNPRSRSAKLRGIEKTS